MTRTPGQNGLSETFYLVVNFHYRCHTWGQLDDVGLELARVGGVGELGAVRQGS